MTESVSATSGQVFQVAINRPIPKAEPEQVSESSQSQQQVEGAREQQQSVEAQRAEKAAEAQRNGRVDTYA